MTFSKIKSIFSSATSIPDNESTYVCLSIFEGKIINNKVIKFAYLGLNQKRCSIWSKRIVEEPKHIATTSINANDVLIYLKRNDCLMLISEKEFDNSLSLADGYLIPDFINTYIDISIPIEEQIKKSRSGFNNARRLIRKNNLSFKFSREKKDYPDFYENMYLPYQKNRHGDDFMKVEFDEIFTDLFRVELIQIMQKDKMIAGGVLHLKNQGVHFSFLGLADHSCLKLGGISVLYFFISQEMHKRGYQELYIGGTPPFLNHSLTSFKINMNNHIDHSSQYKENEQVYLHLLNNSDLLDNWLLRSPFVFIDEYQNHCAAIWSNGRTEISKAIHEQNISKAQRMNLNKIISNNSIPISLKSRN